MRLHTSLTSTDIYAALREEQAKGRIHESVYLEKCTTHSSRSRAGAIEIKLAADAHTPGRRWGNSGGYGATSTTTQSYSATYDEWGWLLANLFDRDAKAIVGSGQYPTYDGASHFHERTGWSYNPHALIHALTTFAGPYAGDGGDRDPYPFINARVPEQVGRIGYGRTDADTVPSYAYEAAEATPGKRKGEWLHYMPRTVEQVRAFAQLDKVATS